MKKIVIRLSGGLGNQMFQYALGKHLEQKNAIVQYDTFVFYRDKLRNYELNQFHTDVELVSTVRNWFHLCCYYTERKLKMKQLVIKLLGEHHEKSLFGFEDDLINYRYLDGCWQNIQYFYDLKTTLQREFVWKGSFNSIQQSVIKDIENQESVMIHLRRGDYLKPTNSALYVVQDQDYYERAVHFVSDKVKEARWYVFSDDIEWCKNLSCFKKDTTFIDKKISNNMYVDFELMKRCRHFIIGNSTFSWWASWLSANEEKVMVAPAQWFYDGELNKRVQQALLTQYKLL